MRLTFVGLKPASPNLPLYRRPCRGIRPQNRYKLSVRDGLPVSQATGETLGMCSAGFGVRRNVSFEGKY